MRIFTRLAQAGLFLVSATAPAAAMPLIPRTTFPLCNAEVIYGTAVVDRNLGAFALRGTQYVFIVSEDVVLDDIEGQQVRVEVAPDCSVRDLHVIGADDDAVL